MDRLSISCNESWSHETQTIWRMRDAQAMHTSWIYSHPFMEQHTNTKQSGKEQFGEFFHQLPSPCIAIAWTSRHSFAQIRIQVGYHISQGLEASYGIGEESPCPAHGLVSRGNSFTIDHLIHRPSAK